MKYIAIVQLKGKNIWETQYSNPIVLLLDIKVVQLHYNMLQRIIETNKPLYKNWEKEVQLEASCYVSRNNGTLRHYNCEMFWFKLSNKFHEKIHVLMKTAKTFC